MHRILLSFIAVCFSLLVVVPAGAQKISQGPRETGLSVLRELSMRDGTLSFRVDSNGCTDASSFKVRVEKLASVTTGVPHYALSIERVKIDECKAFLPEGVLIEIDLATAAGLSGKYTVTVRNPLAVAASAASALPAALRAATAKAIALELEATREKLRSAQGGLGPKENVERFQQKIRGLEGELAEVNATRPSDYPAPVQDTGAVELPADPGPVFPPILRDIEVTIDKPLSDGSLLAVEGTSRSGPFYHVAGIAGGDYGILKHGKRYVLTVCLVYRREYFGQIGDYWVYIMEQR